MVYSARLENEYFINRWFESNIARNIFIKIFKFKLFTLFFYFKYSGIISKHYYKNKFFSLLLAKQTQRLGKKKEFFLQNQMYSFVELEWLA